MLEIRRGIAVKHYENSFFREFAKNLKNMFDKYNLDGLLIANSECIVDERLQIDTLLITQHVVCIIDFKNFSGKIILPHKDDFFNGIWTNEDGNRIKGGSSINPYKQLSIQKKKFVSNPKKNIIGIYDKHIKNNIKDNDCFNPRHTLKIVCFQNKIELIGEIPSRDKIDFFIADKENYLEQIKDIIDVNDKEVNISPKSYNTFKEIFKANQFDLEENYQEKIEVQEDINLDTRNLYQDQEFALKEIQKFLVSKDDKVFILNGSSNSGKSSLVPYIEEIAYKNKFQEIKKLVQSKRIANNLSSKDIKFDSIYAYIYGGQYTTEEINKNDTDIESKIIPLKTNDDEDNCLYIIDEAQLITDSFYKSIDLQFGSGHLLKDLINYINVKESKRKIIFIGDSYQLTIGSKEEVSLDLNYIINQYGLKTKLFSLIDKPNFSILTKEALKPVTQMKKQKYNFLNFDSSSFIRKIEKKDLLVFVKKSLDNDFKILVYSNSDALKINTWIKKSILNNDRDIVFDDLIMFNNNINIENSNDPFAQPQKIFNGEFATVISVNSTIIEEPIYFKNKQILLKFRELQVKLKTGETAKILSFENFRLNQKNELSDDEVIAYQILLNQLLQVENKNNPFEQSSHYRKFISSEKYKSLKAEVINLQNKLARGERVKAKKEELEKHLRKLEKEVKRKYKRELEQKLYSDTSSKLYRYKNTAWIKFGWAITVHKAISYKFNEVLINTDQGNNRGKTNENYFRWIYSAITRATNKAILINYSPITPFGKISINIINETHKAFYFVATNENVQNNGLHQYNFPKEKNYLIDFYQFISSKLNEEITISEIDHKDWQEIYTFNSNKKQTILRFYYNGKNQFKSPQIISSNDKDFENYIIEILNKDLELQSFDSVTSDMKDSYVNLNHKLKQSNIFISYIISTPYKDKLKLINNDDNLLVEFNYNGDGFFTKVNIFTNENNKLCEILQSILKSYNE